MTPGKFFHLVGVFLAGMACGWVLVATLELLIGGVPKGDAALLRALILAGISYLLFAVSERVEMGDTSRFPATKTREATGRKQDGENSPVNPADHRDNAAGRGAGSA